MNALDMLNRKAQRDTITVSPQATVFEAVELLSQYNIGALPVMDGEQLVGMFSERDYTRKVVLMDRLSRQTRVADIMSTTLTIVTPDESVERCLELMTDKHIRHLPVFEENRLIGMLSIGDLVKGLIDKQRLLIEQLQRYISG